VFPARAGMNRHWPQPGRPPPGVPRPRGDEPFSLSIRLPPGPCSPPARG